MKTKIYSVFPACGKTWSYIKEKPSSISSNTYLVDPNTVGQYTGLKDKNGVKIYEGDKILTDLKRPYNIVEYKNGKPILQANYIGS